MRKPQIKGPSPALVIAILALFVAGSGSAYAASKITSSQIQKGAITTSKIASKAVGTGKLKTEAVGTKKLKDKAVTTDQLGDQAVTTDQLGDGAVGAKKMGNIVTRNATTTIGPAPATGTATALCQTDEKVISGGYNSNFGPTAIFIAGENVRASTENGWRVSGINAGSVSVSLTVTAYCLEL
jgi:hypothetical protein